MLNDSHDLGIMQTPGFSAPKEPKTGISGFINYHPFMAASIMAVFLILVGAFVVSQRAPTSPTYQAQGASWGGANVTVLSPTSYSEQPAQQVSQTPIDTSQAQTPPTSASVVIPLPQVSETQTSATDQSQSQSQDQGGGFDFDSFVQMLTHNPITTGTAGNTTSGVADINAYSFIPSGIIATSAPTSRRSATQDSLYNYGNDIGAYIESFELQYPNVEEILTNQSNDRADPNKKAQVVAIGQGLAAIGKSFAGMDDVPPQAATVHKQLAASYIQIGTNLEAIANSQNDQGFLAAVQNYDASADIFQKNYIAMVQIFASYGVTFDPNESGSAFEFNPDAQQQ